MDITLYINLFYAFFKIGLFGFGGGYGMISLIQYEVCDHFTWMTTKEFADILAISQMTPGPISINTATYVGYTTGGVSGAVVSTFALCLPSLLMMWFVLRFLFKNQENNYVKWLFSGLKPAVVGLIFSAAVLMMNEENFIDWLSVIICAASFALLYFWKANPILLILASGAVGIVYYGYF